MGELKPSTLKHVVADGRHKGSQGVKPTSFMVSATIDNSNCSFIVLKWYCIVDLS